MLIADRQSGIVVSAADQSRIDEEVARDFAHRFEHPAMFDAAGDDLFLNHLFPGPGKVLRDRIGAFHVASENRRFMVTVIF